MKRTTITLPEEMAALVAHEASRTGRSVSEIVRIAIAEKYFGSKNRRIPWAAICDDPSMPRGASMENDLEGWDDEIDRRGR